MDVQRPYERISESACYTWRAPRNLLLSRLDLDSSVCQEPALPLPLTGAVSLKVEWSPYTGAVPSA